MQIDYIALETFGTAYQCSKPGLSSFKFTDDGLALIATFELDIYPGKYLEYAFST